MRLLHVITGLGTGGAEIMLLRTISAQVREGIDCRVASVSGHGSVQDELESLGVPVIDLGAHSLAVSWRAVVRLRRVLREFAPDLVHSWMYHANVVTQLATLAGASQLPIVSAIHHSCDDERAEPAIRRLVRRLDARLSRRSSAVIFVSARSRDQHRQLGYSSHNTVFLPNGFDVNLFSPSTRLREEQRSRLGLRDEEFTIGCIARFAPPKDHETLLRAAAEFISLSPNVRFVLAGRGVTNENPAFSALMSRHRLHDHCLLLGERRDLPALFAAMDVACLSSRTEGLPLSLGEAMASGLSCVATDVGDCAWLLGGTGIIVPPNDHHALANAWRHLEVAGHDARADLGRRARARIEQQLSMQAYLARLHDIYASALHSPAPHTQAHSRHSTSADSRTQP
jgi:glycosyltransferase involved in cell wall biosynthesis